MKVLAFGGAGRICRRIQNIMYDKNASSGIDLWQWTPKQRSESCGYGMQIAIEPNGFIKACTAGEVVGNILNMNLSDVTNVMKSLAIKNSVENLDECKDCSLRFLCGKRGITFGDPQVEVNQNLNQS